MRPSSLGGGRILRRTLSVRLSVRPSVRPVIVFVYFFYSRTVLRANIQNRKKLLFSLTGQRYVCTFRHAQRAAYRTAISAAQTCFNQRLLSTSTLHTAFRLDALALSVIATATWLAGWLAGRRWPGGWLADTLRYCIKTAEPIGKLFRPSESPIILVF